MIEYGLTLVTAATSEPVTLQEAQAFMRVTTSEEDALIEDQLIPAAREWCEEWTGRQFVSATYDLSLDRFPTDEYPWDERRTTYRPDAIRVPRPPLSSVTSITYMDEDGTSQTLSASLYRVDTKSIVGEITPAYGEVWPDTYDTTNAVTVRFVCGYSTVPASIKQAVLIVCQTMYENREETGPANLKDGPMTARRLLSAFRVLRFA